MLHLDPPLWTSRNGQVQTGSKAVGTAPARDLKTLTVVSLRDVAVAAVVVSTVQSATYAASCRFFAGRCFSGTAGEENRWVKASAPCASSLLSTMMPLSKPLD